MSCLHPDVIGSSRLLSVTGILVVALLVPQLSAAIGRPTGSQGTALLTPKEWEEFEANLKNVPFFILTMDRPRALALVLAGLESRSPEVAWGSLAVMLCQVDGAERRQLTADQYPRAFRAALECLAPFQAVALTRALRSASDSSLKAQVQYLQDASAAAAFESGNTAMAKALAMTLLEQNTDPASSTYGTIVHNANQVLGRVALREGNVTDAKRYLLRAGSTPGSPTLNSYGPQLFLAREFLERGERAIVLEYLTSSGASGQRRAGQNSISGSARSQKERFRRRSSGGSMASRLTTVYSA